MTADNRVVQRQDRDGPAGVGGRVFAREHGGD